MGDGGVGVGDFGSNPADTMSLAQAKGTESAEISLADMEAIAEAQATGVALGPGPSAGATEASEARVGTTIESPRAWEKEKEKGEEGKATKSEMEKARKKRRRPSLLETEEGLISTTPAYQRSLLR